MPEPRIFRFKIDGPFTPETIPMTRLAEYMAPIAAILGEPEHVHFVNVVPGSTVLVQRVDAEAAPKVRDRIDRTRRGEGPPDAMAALHLLNRKLREDNGKATLLDESAEVLEFPGRDEVRPIRFAAFDQDGTLDGIVIRLGGTKEMVPVRLENGPTVYQCLAHRAVAKRLAPHIFSAELRVKGTGRWLVDEHGTWTLERFTIADFDVLSGDPLMSVVSEVREMGRDGWREGTDPWADLMRLRGEGEDLH